MKKVYIRTFGCQMNEKDSEIVLLLLQPDFVPTEDPGSADLIFINTCSVREKPQHKVYSEIGRFKELKKKKPDLLIGVMGCVAQQEGEKIVEKYPYVDIVLGTQAFYQIRQAIELRLREGRPVVWTELKPDFKPPLVLGSNKPKRVKASLPS